MYQANQKVRRIGTKLSRHMYNYLDVLTSSLYQISCSAVHTSCFKFQMLK